MGSHSSPKQERLAATLRLHFRYGGRRVFGITTMVSGRDLIVVSDARLPSGAIIVLDIQTDGDEARPGPELRIVAQVVSSGPAPFGTANAYASEVTVSRASRPSWQALLDVVSAPAPRPPERHVSRRASDFLALYRISGVWFRGEVVLANLSALWVRTACNPPAAQEHVLVRIPVLDAHQQVSIEVDGRIPTEAIGEHESPAWLFEVVPSRVSPTSLYHQLVEATGGS